MPTAPPMRHHNSPEEIKKREASGDEPKPKGKGFVHYNSPEEVARRERTGNPSAAIAPPRKTPVQPIAPPVDWPPPSLGQRNDVPATEVEAMRREALSGALQSPPGDGDVAHLEARVAQLEHFIYALLDSPGEAREWRMQLNNLQAVTEVQGQMAARVTALEQTLEELSIEDDDGEAPESEPPTEAQT